MEKKLPKWVNLPSRIAVGKIKGQIGHLCKWPVWQMIGNIKEMFPPIKTGLREKQVLQDPGYVGGVEGPCCMLHGILQDCTNTMSKVSKEIK